MNLDFALKFANKILMTKVGRELRKPEVTILVGTWQGMTYEQMANTSSYSANYLMRDVAPKFWKLLSVVLNENVGKSNFRQTLEKLYATQELNIESTKISSLRWGSDRPKQNWNEGKMIPSVFYGRETELKLLQEWIEQEHCQLIKIWGLCGSGKTLLMIKLASQMQEEYELIIWRSLASVPRVSDLLKDLLLTEFNITEKDESKLLSRLIAQMQLYSCLIMLDGVETILQSQALNGQYLSGYEDYEQLFDAVEATSHRSCMVVTCLENFGRGRARQNYGAVRNLRLSGLSTRAAKLLLEPEQIKLNDVIQQLIDYYQGNPAILLTAARIIRELFNGNTEEFLEQQSLVFGEIEEFLNKSFSRLSVLETEILYWLAGESQPMTLKAIQNGIPLSIYDVELIRALESLSQRALIESQRLEERSVFVLTPTIREFVTNQFVAQVGDRFSLANRSNLRAKENTIELGRVTRKPTRLSQWLQNQFESAWQPMDALFTASGRSPARLRSAFNLRQRGVVKRFKQIKLGTQNPETILLLVAISVNESVYQICVQAQPAFDQKTLPPKLQLDLIDASDRSLATIQAKAQDNYIQLPYFRGEQNEQFKIGLRLAAEEYQEDFAI